MEKNQKAGTITMSRTRNGELGLNKEMVPGLLSIFLLSCKIKFEWPGNKTYSDSSEGADGNDKDIWFWLNWFDTFNWFSYAHCIWSYDVCVLWPLTWQLLPWKVQACYLVLCLAHTHLLARNCLVNVVEFLWLITQSGNDQGDHMISNYLVLSLQH